MENIDKRSGLEKNDKSVTIIIIVSLIGIIIFLSLFYIYYRNFIKKDEGGGGNMCHSCFNNSSNDVQQDEIMSERSFYAASVQSSMMEEENENEKKNVNALKKLSSRFFRNSNSHEMAANANKIKQEKPLPTNYNNPNALQESVMARNEFEKENPAHQDIVSIQFSNSSNYMVDEDSSLERYHNMNNNNINNNNNNNNNNLNNNMNNNRNDPHQNNYYDNSNENGRFSNDGSAEEHSYGRSWHSNNRKKTHDDEETMETRELKEKLTRIKANLNSYPYGRVICDFEPKEQDEIELHFGDVVDIGCIYENGYAWVKNLRTNEEGMIQVNLLSTDLYNMDSRVNEILENLMKISKIKKQMSKPYIDYTNYYASSTTNPSELDNLKEKTAEEISSIVHRESSSNRNKNKKKGGRHGQPSISSHSNSKRNRQPNINYSNTYNSINNYNKINNNNNNNNNNNGNGNSNNNNNNINNNVNNNNNSIKSRHSVVDDKVSNNDPRNNPNYNNNNNNNNINNNNNNNSNNNNNTNNINGNNNNNINNRNMNTNNMESNYNHNMQNQQNKYKPFLKNEKMLRRSADQEWVKEIKETMKEMDGALETEEQLIKQFDLENPTSQIIDDTSIKPHDETSEFDRTIDDKSYMMDITETEYISDVSFDISQYNINQNK